MSVVRSFPTPGPGSAPASRANAHSNQAPAIPRFVLSTLTVLFALCAFVRPSSAQDSPEVIRQKIEAAYPLTKTMADKSDIVTAGAILILQKDNLEMSATTNNIQAQDTYKGGKISASGATSTAKILNKCHFCPHNDQAGTFRTFVAGEKFWLTKVEVRDDGVYLNFFTDPLPDTRYISTLKIPFTKGTPQTADALLATIGEVIKVQPSDDAQSSDKAAPASSSPADRSAPAKGAASSAPMAPIAPPPPPPDAPPSRAPAASGASASVPIDVEIGQTKEQVVAMLGNPTRIAKLPTKEIDFYPNMKITFVKNKVSDVQ